MSFNPLDLIPDIDFAPGTAQEILAEMVADYEQRYLEETGQKISVPPSSKERIYLSTEAYRFYLAYRQIDYGCKMNLLKYSVDGFLDNLGAWFGLPRQGAKQSVSKVLFKLTAPQANSVVIPKGTKLSTPTKVFFATKEDTIIPAGENSAECDIVSVGAGEHTAGFLPGQINILVEPVPFVASVTNTETSQGGADVESNEHYRLRIYNYLDTLSVAGPFSAYRALILQFSQVIEDVNPTNPSPGVVDIRLTLTGGQMPESAFLNSIYEYLEEKRPTTDQLSLAAPEITHYDLDCTFYIARSNRQRQAEIINKVNEAVAEFEKWQTSKIGRDLSPDKLTSLLVEAGAKRIPIRSPAFEVIGEDHICRQVSCNVEFGGVEDD